MESNNATCEANLLLLSRGLDLDLSRREIHEIYIHVASCDSCRKAMGEMAKVDVVVKNLHLQEAQAELGMDFHVDFLRKLNQRSAQSPEQQLSMFGREVAHSATLRTQLNAAPNEDAFVALYVHLGHTSGYLFNSKHVTSLFAANDELNDSQLEQVAAAGNGFNSQKLLDLLVTWTPR